MGNGRDTHPRANAKPAQDQGQRIRAIGAANRALGAKPGSVFFFKRRAFLAQDVPTAREGARNGSVNLGLLGAIPGAGISLRDHGHDGRIHAASLQL